MNNNKRYCPVLLSRQYRFASGLTMPFSIDFAPLVWSWKSASESAAVLHVVILYLFAPICATLLFLFLLFTEYYWISLLYMAWMWYDNETSHQGGRRIFTTWHFKIWHYVASYFPTKLIKTCDLDAKKNYFFVFHPHGIMLLANALVYTDDFRTAFPGIKMRLIVSTFLFYVPFLREYLLLLGMCASSPQSIEYVLTKQGVGSAAGLYPGGLAEILEAHPDTATLKLKSRKGFIRIALRTGASLVPVYNFGETDVYGTLPNAEGSLMRKLQTWAMGAFKIPLTVLNGRGFLQSSFGLMPHRYPICMVVGKPIDVEKIENPSTDVIDKYHSLYMVKLKELFDEFKLRLCDGKFKNQELHIK